MSEKRSAWDIVQIARDPKRITSQYIINNIFTDFLEMHGDKLFADDAAVIGGVGFLEGIPVTVIGQEKGVDLRDKVNRNFGCSNPEGYRKSLRLMRQAEKFHRPVICIVDTQGAFCGIGAEERGVAESIARNLMEMSGLTVPVLAIVTGEGSSGGALGLGVANHILMLENVRVFGVEPRRICQHFVERCLPQRRSLYHDETDGAGLVYGWNCGRDHRRTAGRCTARAAAAFQPVGYRHCRAPCRLVQDEWKGIGRPEIQKNTAVSEK